MTNLHEGIKKWLEKANTEILFVHTDIRKGFKTIFNGDKSEFFSNHIEHLMKFNIDLFFPVFNYNFSKTKVFDVVNDVSQVGVLNEFFRKNYSQWQTPIPFYSITGIGEMPEYDISDKINLFDETSIWNYLYQNNCAIVYYGASISATTLIHFVEKISNTLCYRYEKNFNGHVVFPMNKKTKISVTMHVRPMNNYLDYDWVKIENDLYQSKILLNFKDGLTEIKIVSVRALVDFWLSKLNQNKLYFLDNKSILWIKPLLIKMNRPFEQSDFE